MMTTSQGHPVFDNQNSQTAGEYGPMLIQDFQYIDKLAKFDRERIPERVVHAKGTGAFGYLEITHDITHLCKAELFDKVGKRTPCFGRFSTVIGEKGSADSDRDPRGFSMKFYTQEGVWDMVGNNTPIFFIRDPMKFPDFIHCLKPHPENHLRNVNTMWDFLSLVPESAHQLTILYSDRGTPYSNRNMHGFGSHTFRWVNDKNEAVFVKFHFLTDQGIKNFTNQEALNMRGIDPDFARRELWEAIESKKPTSWTFYVQVIPEADAEKYRYNILDVTKTVSHADYPLIPVGKLVLNANPSNFFAEVEQAAFSPAHMPPGIEPSFDKMLQGRLFSYTDTHRHRLGGNSDQIPVNCPYRTRVNSGERDGIIRVNGNHGGKVNFEPNTVEPFSFSERAKLSYLPVRGHVMRFKPAHPNSDFEQPGILFRKVMTETDRDHLIANLVGDLKPAKKELQERQLRVFYKCDPEYGNRLAKELGLAPVKAKL